MQEAVSMPRPIRSWIDALALTAGVLGGVVLLLSSSLIGGSRSIKRTARRTGDTVLLPRRIYGHTKREVARLLGPPPAAATSGEGTAAPTFWDADTWYYPANPRQRTAVAVQFNEDRVVRVEYLARLV
jgi:hypothetical protein